MQTKYLKLKFPSCRLFSERQSETYAIYLCLIVTHTHSLNIFVVQTRLWNNKKYSDIRHIPPSTIHSSFSNASGSTCPKNLFGRYPASVLIFWHFLWVYPLWEPFLLIYANDLENCFSFPLPFHSLDSVYRYTVRDAFNKIKRKSITYLSTYVTSDGH